MVRLSILSLLLSLLCLSSCATGVAESIPLASAIVVYKSEHKLELVGADGIPFRTYQIAMGGNPVGPKECEGDERTPEGLYSIERHNPDSKYHLSLKISYPNDQDKKNAEMMGLSPGGDIFIHGVPNDAWFLQALMYRYNPTWTNGCIAVSNSDIEEIWRSVPDGTPVEIYP